MGLVGAQSEDCQSQQSNTNYHDGPGCGWLASWFADWLPGRVVALLVALPGLVVGWLAVAGWLADWLAGQLAAWPGDCLAG